MEPRDICLPARSLPDVEGGGRKESAPAPSAGMRTAIEKTTEAVSTTVVAIKNHRSGPAPARSFIFDEQGS
jgi:hypothetical protein